MPRMVTVLAVVAAAWLGMAAIGVAGSAFPGDKVDRMEAAQLLSLLDSPSVVIIDVRRGKDWEGSELMIKNAVRAPYNDVESWAGKYDKEQTIVLYCA